MYTLISQNKSAYIYIYVHVCVCVFLRDVIVHSSLLAKRNTYVYDINKNNYTCILS